MKRTVLFCVALMALVGCAVEGSETMEAKPEVKVSVETAKPEAKVSAEAATPELKTVSDKFSYLIGMNVAQSLAQVKGQLDVKMLIHGLTDGLAGKKPVISQEEARKVFEAMRNLSMKKAEEKGMKNQKIGDEFLADNGKVKDVATTASGLQYTIIKKGDGPKPMATDTVRVHYRGTLIDGTEFDSSYKRGKPATFPVNRVIAGWTEALQLMNVGTKCKLFVPAKLAYGSRGAGQLIGPNAVLIFEVELIGIEAPPKPE